MTQSLTAQAKDLGAKWKRVSTLPAHASQRRRLKYYMPGKCWWTGVDLASGPDATGFFVGGTASGGVA